MTQVLQAGLLSRFTCLGDRCEDTCCQGWSMQVDAPTVERYRKEAPELLDAVETSPDAPWIMRKDPKSSFCVKLEGGLCDIHKKYGAEFLGDACYFYPRVTRSLGDKVVMTASMSCPEIARLALGDDADEFSDIDLDRLPRGMKDYLPEELSHDDALAVHRAFLAATRDTQASAEQLFTRIASASRSLERIDRKSWTQAAPFYLAHADSRIPPAQANPMDCFNLLHALCGLVVASHKTPSARFSQTINEMEKALAVTLNWQDVQIDVTDASLAAHEKLHALWMDKGAALYAPVLSRWLRMQLSLALYPFSGLGATLSERVTIIGVRLATIKLALMCACGIHGVELPQDVVIRLVQSLARFLDHLGDAGYSLQIYGEAGWTQEDRMRGLLEM